MNEHYNPVITYNDIIQWKATLKLCKDDINSNNRDLTVCAKRLYHEMCFLVSFVESLLQFEYMSSVNDTAKELQKEIKQNG